MATVTPGKIFTSNEVVTPANLNALGVPTVSNIVTADIADANITELKIADANVTTVKIADGAVTQSKLDPSVILFPIGAVMPFATTTAPTGWLQADGTEYSKTSTYAALFGVIGTTFGETDGSNGTGTTHFRVPDLRGYFIRGSGINIDSTASGTFGTKQTDAFKTHDHRIASRVTVSASTEITANQFLAANNTFVQNYLLAGTSTPPTLGLTGSTGTTETRPKNIALLYCIKF